MGRSRSSRTCGRTPPPSYPTIQHIRRPSPQSTISSIVSDHLTAGRLPSGRRLYDQPPSATQSSLRFVWQTTVESIGSASRRLDQRHQQDYCTPSVRPPVLISINWKSLPHFSQRRTSSTGTDKCQRPTLLTYLVSHFNPVSP